ncbi:hypothetical protein C8Q73DRAFT_793783 [Cubamyces lactineus]|nr:hypothetical protein C8Q73DRAFT_793783 [Cubamyces lactineus]
MESWLKLVRPDRWSRGLGGLLAASPSAFRNASSIAPMSSSEFGSALGDIIRPDALPDIQCTFTPEGAHIRLLWYPIPPQPSQREDSSRKDTPVRCSCHEDDSASIFALLRCRDGTGQILALVLRVNKTLLSHGQDGRARLPVCAAHQSSHRVIPLPRAWKTWTRATPSSSRALLGHSDVPLLINPILDPSNPVDIERALSYHVNFSLRLAPWCKEKMRAIGLRTSAIGRVGRFTHRAYHLLLEDRRSYAFSVKGSLSQQWVLTSRIHIVVLKPARFHVRHQSVLTPQDSRSKLMNLRKLERMVYACIAADELQTHSAESASLLSTRWLEYELPRHTGLPYRRLRLSAVRDSNHADPLNSTQATSGGQDHITWLSIQFCELGEPEELPAPEMEHSLAGNAESWTALPLWPAQASVNPRPRV